MSFGFPPFMSRRRTHVHVYLSLTSMDVGHIHWLVGVTSPTIGYGSSHVHRMKGTTTFNDGHTHNYNIITGPAIPIGPGIHVHRFRGTTTINGKTLHRHRFFGLTAPALDDTAFSINKKLG